MIRKISVLLFLFSLLSIFAQTGGTKTIIANNGIVSKLRDIFRVTNIYSKINNKKPKKNAVRLGGNVGLVDVTSDFLSPISYSGIASRLELSYSYNAGKMLHVGDVSLKIFSTPLSFSNLEEEEFKLTYSSFDISYRLLLPIHFKRFRDKPAPFRLVGQAFYVGGIFLVDSYSFSSKLLGNSSHMNFSFGVSSKFLLAFKAFKLSFFGDLSFLGISLRSKFYSNPKEAVSDLADVHPSLLYNFVRVNLGGNLDYPINNSFGVFGKYKYAFKYSLHQTLELLFSNKISVGLYLRF